MSTYLVVLVGTALWHLFKGVKNCFCNHGLANGKPGKDAQTRVSLLDSFSSCF